MFVSHLSLTDFRNYEHADVTLHPGANLFVGSNGQGKTNLVESLGYLSTLGSHRVSGDQALVRKGQDAAIVRARLEHAGRQLLVEMQINRQGANRAQVNRSAVKPREVPRYFSSVMFAPEDLSIVRGEPSGRRRFLDELLVLLSPRITGILADYDRVLRQRNTLLKSARASGVRGDRLSTLEVWDEQLVTFGSEIVAARMQLVDHLAPLTAEAYTAIAGQDHEVRLENRLTVLSASGDDEDEDEAGTAGVIDVGQIAAAFRERVQEVRRAELDRAVTLVGPHRDDLVLLLNGLPARGYASHGESWSYALALRLASVEVLRRDSSVGDPVLMLDDVFAELDEARRERLALAVSGVEQVLITAAVHDDVPESLRANTVHIRAGEIVATDLESRGSADD